MHRARTEMARLTSEALEILNDIGTHDPPAQEARLAMRDSTNTPSSAHNESKCRLHATPIAFFLVFVALGCSRSDEGAKRDASLKDNDTTTSNLKSSTVPPSLGIVEWYPDNNPKVILQMRGDSVLERIEYYASGQVQSRGQLLEDARHGIWNSYYSQGCRGLKLISARGPSTVYRTLP